MIRFEYIRIVVFIIFPIAYTLIRNRGSEKLPTKLGLIKLRKNDIIYTILICLLSLVIFSVGLWLSYDINKLMIPKDYFGSLSGYFIIASLVYSKVIHSSFETFGEELFFRGLIGKNLIGVLGFFKGNLIQAILYGISEASVVIILGLYSSSIPLIISGALKGFFIGWLTEKKCNGSIIPIWLGRAIASGVEAIVLVLLNI